MIEQAKFVYMQNLVPACKQRNEHGLWRMISQGADGSFNASDLGIKFELSPEARKDIAAIGNNIRRPPRLILLWRGWDFLVD